MHPFKHPFTHIVSDEVSDLIRSCIQNSLKDFPELSRYDLTSINSHLALPPKFEFGQVAFPCFLLSKYIKMQPDKIAKFFSEWINLQNLTFVKKSTNKVGYLNFFLNFHSLGERVFKGIEKGSFFSAHILNKNKKRLLIEFSQPNTHKAIHVGHLRNLVLGEALSRLKEYRGHKVIRVTYLGDFGTHISKVIWYLNQNKIEQDKFQSLDKKNKAKWLGEQYSKANLFLKEIKDPRLEVKYGQEISKTLKKLQIKKGPLYEFYLKTRDISLKHIQEVYDWFDTQFYKWYFESELDEDSEKFILQKFNENVLVKSKGAIGMNLEKENLGFVLLLKSDGSGLYLTKDIELLRRKFKDFDVDQSIVIVDVRQQLHFNQLFFVCENLGIASRSQSLHLWYESVVDEKGLPISSREKPGMEISELRDKMISLVKDSYLSKYKNLWNKKEINETANKIVVSALKYGMVRIDPHSQIKFSTHKWLQLEGDTGPYIEYVYARSISILNLLKKEGFLKTDDTKSKNQIVINHQIRVSDDKLKNQMKEEKQVHQNTINTIKFETQIECELLYLLSKFNDIVILSSDENKPHILANYLFNLAQNFNRFYKDCKVVSCLKNDLKQTRARLVFATSEVIKKGLNLLGIPSVDRM